MRAGARAPILALVEERERAAKPRGVLRTPPGLVHRRLLVATPLREHIAHVAWVAWDVAAPFVTQTLPHPTCHLVFEGRSAELVGVHTGRFQRELVGRGRMIGIKFRPAAISPSWDGPLSALRDRRVDARQVFESGVETLRRRLSRSDTLEEALPDIEAFLARRLAPLPPEVRQIRDVVEAMEGDRSMLRVEEVAKRYGLGVRTLERRFAAMVGVSPKWVLSRYRLHEAAERLRDARAPSLTRLAAQLGYADQAHFSRDFKRVIGCAPSAM